MKLCKRCKGAGSLTRPKKGIPVRNWFKNCTNCAGTGMRPALRYLRIADRKPYEYLQPPMI
ncbi:MAG: hypothetical protein KBD50_00160 [Candidatus Pacebacteria bacterium]|nr:hypothetical protein [Candidatus Paceibacterota bacterium]